MSVSALMEAMAEAGAPLEAILLAVKALEAKDAEISARRAQAAERKRAERARKRQSQDSHATVTGHGEDASPNEETSIPLSSETKVSSEGDKPRARKAEPFPRPEWADKQVWIDFLANRKRRRMVNTPTAHKQFLGDIARLADDEWPPGKLLEHAAAKGWGSINKPEDQGNGRQRTNGMGRNRGAGSQDDGLSATRRAALRVFGSAPARHPGGVPG